MTNHVGLIMNHILHLEKMAEYLDFSYSKIAAVLPITEFDKLTPETHETLAAFRVRFSEFQEHLGKTMRAVAIEEEIDVERFGSVLAFMERLKVIDSAEHWKLIRELRNAVNHEYEDDQNKLSDFFNALYQKVPVVKGYFLKLREFAEVNYRQ